LQKYERLSNGGGGARKVKLGSNDMDTLGSIRVKLISHQTSLTSFLDRIQLHQSGDMAPTLDNQDVQLDVILDKVDAIAAIGQRSGSILTGYDDDDKEVWKQFRRELIKEGFSDDILAQHKVILHFPTMSPDHMLNLIFTGRSQSVYTPNRPRGTVG
jgi:hypothetical protein